MEGEELFFFHFYFCHVPASMRLVFKSLTRSLLEDINHGIGVWTAAVATSGFALCKMKTNIRCDIGEQRFALIDRIAHGRSSRGRRERWETLETAAV